MFYSKWSQCPHSPLEKKLEKIRISECRVQNSINGHLVNHMFYFSDI